MEPRYFSQRKLLLRLKVHDGVLQKLQYFYMLEYWPCFGEKEVGTQREMRLEDRYQIMKNFKCHVNEFVTFLMGRKCEYSLKAFQKGWLLEGIATQKACPDLHIRNVMMVVMQSFRLRKRKTSVGKINRKATAVFNCLVFFQFVNYRRIRMAEIFLPVCLDIWQIFEWRSSLYSAQKDFGGMKKKLRSY